MKTDRFLSARETAERFGVTTRTVLRWIQSGRLHGFRCGRRTIRLSWPEVLKTLETKSERNRPEIKP